MKQVVSYETDELKKEFLNVRQTTMLLFDPLSIEDAVMQSDPFGSPPNWHLAHVTWFFHKMLEEYGLKVDDRKIINSDYLNSYYQRYKSILPKSERGKFPRPTVNQTIEYRKEIEKRLINMIEKIGKENALTEKFAYDLMLANQHEMQHQELMIYDFQHYFNRYQDPTDNYTPKNMNELKKPNTNVETGMVTIPGGIYYLGFDSYGFSYDNELPEHKVYLHPYQIDIYPVTNADYMKFMTIGGYEDYRFWLADGWDLIRQNNWKAPLYWETIDGQWYKKDFRGLSKVAPEQPVTNVCYYEADAFARWMGKRIPTEAEWEKASSWNEELKKKTKYPWGDELPTDDLANLLESWMWSASDIGTYPKGKSYYGCHQMIGDVWEWTSSEYVLYPGFKSRFQEYTDKWSINQKVLRGGSFATSKSQIRNSYRNYFKPHERILFSGFRCAKDLA